MDGYKKTNRIIKRLKQRKQEEEKRKKETNCNKKTKAKTKRNKKKKEKTSRGILKATYCIKIIKCWIVLSFSPPPLLFSSLIFPYFTFFSSLPSSLSPTLVLHLWQRLCCNWANFACYMALWKTTFANFSSLNELFVYFLSKASFLLWWMCNTHIKKSC